MTGRVFAHVGQRFDEDAYDFLVVGGGRMGLAAAFYLKTFLPRARLLIVERSGIPSEGGATDAAPGVWHGADLPREWRAQARWTRSVWQRPEQETGTHRPHDLPFRGVGWVRLHEEESHTPTEAWLSGLPADAREQLAELVDLSLVRGVEVDALGGWGSPTTLALAYGYAAVRLGADLLLNTEARLDDGGAVLSRLDITPTMQVVVAEERRVHAGHVVVASGSESVELLERGLGVLRPHGRAFAQFPVFHLAAVETLPILSWHGLTFRPGPDVSRLVPPLPSPDPAGYVPVGGQLLGVPVGVRRETVDQLLGALDAWPGLGGPGLALGKTLGDVPGAWFSLPRGGWPLWEEAAPGVSLLLGGPEADRVGPAVALDLAATLAGREARPWDDLDDER